MTALMTPEEAKTTHLGVVQVGGIVSRNNVISRSFASQDSALEWVRSEVERAHGDPPQEWYCSVPMHRIDETGIPFHWGALLISVRTAGGPTWGFVVEAL